MFSPIVVNSKLEKSVEGLRKRFNLNDDISLYPSNESDKSNKKMSKELFKLIPIELKVTGNEEVDQVRKRLYKMYEIIEKRKLPWTFKKQTKTLIRLQICSNACVHALDALYLKSEYSMRQGMFLLNQQDIDEGVKGIQKERGSDETKEYIENLRKEFIILIDYAKEKTKRYFI